jgi:hypothetical protein
VEPFAEDLVGDQVVVEDQGDHGRLGVVVEDRAHAGHLLGAGAIDL